MIELNLRKEEELLLLCVRSRVEPELKDKIRSLLERDLDWKYLTNLASRNSLKPLLYWQLNFICPNVVPEIIMTDLRSHFDSNTKKNLKMLGELLNILNLFDSNEINSIPYKGPILAILAYNNLSLREFGDLDLFVNINDVFAARKILIDKGYRKTMNLTKMQEQAYLKFQREFLFVNGIHVEIKWKLISPLFSVKNPSRSLLSPNTKKSFEISNSKFETISNEELIVLLSVHNASHYWSSLSLICDIFEVIQSDESIKWSQVLQIAEKDGFKRILSINLVLINELMGLKIPENIHTVIDKDKSVKKISNQIKARLFLNNYSLNLMDKMILRIRIRESYRNKIKDFTNMLFLPTPNVISAISIPVPLFPLYYILRFVQLFKNIVKNYYR